MNQPTDAGIGYDDHDGMGVAHPGNGNLISYSGFTYTYDAQNRLRHAENTSSGTMAGFYYDGLNRQEGFLTGSELTIDTLSWC